MYTINEEYYLPLELISKAGHQATGNWYTKRDEEYYYFGDEDFADPNIQASKYNVTASPRESGGYTFYDYTGIDYIIDLQSGYRTTKSNTVAYSANVKPSAAVGEAEKSRIAVRCANDNYEAEEDYIWLEDVYTINGDFPMVSFNSLQNCIIEIAKTYTEAEKAVKFYEENIITYDAGTNTFLIGKNLLNAEVVAERDLVGEYLGTIITEGMTDRQKVTAIHDFLINHLDYNMATHYLDTYGFLIGEDPTNGKWDKALEEEHRRYQEAVNNGFMTQNNNTLWAKWAICETYSSLFQEFCDRLSIPNVYMIGGAPSGISHGWNKVYIEGVWLYVDCTWDDPVGGGKEGNTYLLRDADFMINEGYKFYDN